MEWPTSKVRSGLVKESWLWACRRGEVFPETPRLCGGIVAAKDSFRRVF